MRISRVFIAKDGGIAVRMIRACQGLRIETIAGVSDADRKSLLAKIADRAICFRPARFHRRASPPRWAKERIEAFFGGDKE